MQTKKLIGISLAAALVASTAAISVNAIVDDVSKIKDHSVGIVGSFNQWGGTDEAPIPDVPMTDDDGDGIYEGTVTIEEATEDMVVEATMDDGKGNQVARGMTGITFKVRLDGGWLDSWGDYEPAYVRTGNSQTNCCVECAVGDKVVIKVQLDTTRNTQQAIDDGQIAADDEVFFDLIPVTYTATINGSDEQSSDEQSSQEQSSQEQSSQEQSSQEESSKEESSKEEQSSQEQSSEQTSQASEVSTLPKDEDYTTQIKDYIFFKLSDDLKKSASDAAAADDRSGEWNEVYVYFWNDGYTDVKDLTGAFYPEQTNFTNDEGEAVFGQDFGHYWPGIKMDQVPGTDVWQAKIPFGATKIIFNSGVKDDDVHAGVVAFQNDDMHFDQVANAGQIFVIDTKEAPKHARGVEKTKYKYSAGAWEDYKGEYISETFKADKIASDVPSGETSQASEVKTTGGDDNKGTNNNNNTNGGSNGGSTVVTGDGTVTTGDSTTTMAIAFAAIAVAALGAALIASKKRKVQE